MSPVELIVTILGLLAILVIGIVWRGAHPTASESSAETEATIQSVGKVNVSAGRSSYTIEVADFSYSVNNEYYSGRMRVSPSLSGDDHSTRDLVNQKFQVSYNLAKPEKFSVAQTEVGGFALDPYSDSFGQNYELDPIDLGIDKV